MKKLKPALREKKRYIAFQVEGERQYSKREVVREIVNQSLSFFGESGASEFNLWVVEFNEALQQGFLVCHNKAVGKLKACLGLIGSIGEEKVHFRVLGVSGTIKSLRRKFLNNRQPFKSESREEFFQGMKVRIVRSMGNCVDAIPHDEELQDRLRKLMLKYIGLMENDLGGKKDATSTQHGL
jgi:ribonuclease P/MRP protein subunit POP5